MRRIVVLALAALMLLALAACGGGNVDNVTVPDWKPSEIYPDADVEAAIRTVKEYFKAEFDGCTLTKVSYPGDTYADEFHEWAEQYGADEAIVLFSSFDVGSSGGDGSLTPNTTYTEWKWVLVRDAGGDWHHATHGYG